MKFIKNIIISLKIKKQFMGNFLKCINKNITGRMPLSVNEKHF